MSVAAAHIVLQSIGGEVTNPWDFAPLIVLIFVLTVYIAVLEHFHG